MIEIKDANFGLNLNISSEELSAIFLKKIEEEQNSFLQNMENLNNVLKAISTRK